MRFRRLIAALGIVQHGNIPLLNADYCFLVPDFFRIAVSPLDNLVLLDSTNGFKRILSSVTTTIGRLPACQ